MRLLIPSLIVVFVLGSFSSELSAQVFYQQSFESESGWSLSHTFDSGASEYCKRDSAVALDYTDYFVFGQNGFFVIAAEDTDGVPGESPDDGLVTLELDPVSITGLSNIELVVSLSCYADASAYDDRSQANGDYLDFQVNVDGGGWQVIGSFNSQAGGSSISTLYQDVDMDGNGGELGELPVDESFSDYVIPVGDSGNTIQVRAVFRMNGGDEVLLLDNFRLRESEGDDIPPSVFSAQVIDQNTLQIVFQEPLGANAEQMSLYSGITGLSSATLQADGQTVVLDYTSDFVIGEQHQLVVFGVQDVAGNGMAGVFNFPFYYNPTTPDLIITEIMYNDPSSVDTLEFIEIYNNGATAATVGGFRLEDAISHTLASVTIAPGGFYLVARKEEAATAFYSMSFFDYSGQLSDNSERIALVNVLGEVIDEVEYNDNVPWPTAADGTGPSMELVSTTLDNSIGNNWVASSNGLGVVNGFPLSATPGALAGVTLPVLEFDNNDIVVNEVDGVFEIDIYVSAANTSQMEISIELLGGSADFPDDHGLGTIASLILPANSDGLESLAFPLVNDAIQEGVEYFSVQMTAVSNCQIGINNEATILILDDDQESPELYINELQASNLTTIQDGFGDFDDWFEVYNPNSFAVDLAGYFVSDNPANPMKDRLSIDGTSNVIPAGGFIVIWADEQGEQGDSHVNFRLSSNGESILLSDPSGEVVVDEVDFSSLFDDISYGRFCDGDDTWQEFATPTPGASNCPDGLTEYSFSLTVFPNPAHDVLRLPTAHEYVVYNMLGEQLLTGYSEVVDLHSLDSGLYTIWTVDGGWAVFVKE